MSKIKENGVPVEGIETTTKDDEVLINEGILSRLLRRVKEAQGSCGGTPRRDGSGKGIGNIGTERQPKEQIDEGYVDDIVIKFNEEVDHNALLGFKQSAEQIANHFTVKEGYTSQEVYYCLDEKLKSVLGLK